MSAHSLANIIMFLYQCFYIYLRLVYNQDFYIYLSIYLFCMWDVGECTMVHVCRTENNSKKEFSPSLEWVPGNKLTLSNLAASTSL